MPLSWVRYVYAAVAAAKCWPAARFIESVRDECVRDTALRDREVMLGMALLFVTYGGKSRETGAVEG